MNISELKELAINLKSEIENARTNNDKLEVKVQEKTQILMEMDEDQEQ